MNGWLHSPATLPQTPTEKEAVTASEMISDVVERTEISFSCQQLKHKFLHMQPTAQSLISLSYSISVSCKLCYPTHNTLTAVKRVVAIWGLPDLMVPQGVQGTNNFLNTNAMKQTPLLHKWILLQPVKKFPHITGHDRFIRVFVSICWYWFTDMHCHHKQQGISHLLACSSTWVFFSPFLP